ncbi:hypothetical protein GEMRC1_006608 [Eukaryota sp. GEM-RC1]
MNAPPVVSSDVEEARQKLKEQYSVLHKQSPKEKLASFRESRLSGKPSTSFDEPPSSSSSTTSLFGTRGFKLLQKRKELLNQRKQHQDTSVSPPSIHPEPSLNSHSPITSSDHPSTEQTEHENSQEALHDDSIKNDGLPEETSVIPQNSPMPIQASMNEDRILEIFNNEISKFQQEFDNSISELRQILNNDQVKQEELSSVSQTNSQQISNCLNNLKSLGDDFNAFKILVLEHQQSIDQQMKSLENSHQLIESLYKSSIDSLKNRICLLEDTLSSRDHRKLKAFGWLLVNYFFVGLSTVLIPITGSMYSITSGVKKAKLKTVSGIHRVRNMFCK